MNFTDGLDAALLDHGAPIITDYAFFILGHTLWKSGKWAGEPLK